MSDDALRRIRHLAALGDGQVLLELGYAHLKSNEYLLAEAAFRASNTAGETRALRSLAWVVDISGRLEEAERLYREAIDAGDQDAVLDLADMIFVLPGRSAEAEGLLQSAIVNELPSAHYILGKLLAREPGREIEAAVALDAETNSSLRGVAQWELACLLERLPGRGADVEAALRQSGTPEATMKLAEILSTRPDSQVEAIELMRRAAYMGNSRAWNNLIVFLKNLELVDDANEAYADAIRSGRGELMASYGDFLLTQGMSDKAETVLRQGMPNDPNCALVLGMMLLEHPDRESEARSLLIAAAGAGIVGAAFALGHAGE